MSHDTTCQMTLAVSAAAASTAAAVAAPEAWAEATCVPGRLSSTELIRALATPYKAIWEPSAQERAWKLMIYICMCGCVCLCASKDWGQRTEDWVSESFCHNFACLAAVRQSHERNSHSINLESNWIYDSFITFFSPSIFALGTWLLPSAHTCAAYSFCLACALAFLDRICKLFILYLRYDCSASAYFVCFVVSSALS